MNIITFQPELRPELPDVFASKDYREFRATLVEIPLKWDRLYLS